MPGTLLAALYPDIVSDVGGMIMLDQFHPPLPGLAFPDTLSSHGPPSPSNPTHVTSGSAESNVALQIVRIPGNGLCISLNSSLAFLSIFINASVAHVVSGK